MSQTPLSDVDHSILFVDPGGTSGLGLFGGKGNLKDAVQITGLDNFVKYLTMSHRGTPLAKIFYEPYLIDNDKIFRNSDGSKRKSMLSHDEKKGHQDTLELIGAIQAFGILLNVKTEEIRFTTLKAALKQAGITLPSDHSKSHKFVAVAYGRSFFLHEGITKPSRIPL